MYHLYLWNHMSSIPVFYSFIGKVIYYIVFFFFLSRPSTSTSTSLSPPDNRLTRILCLKISTPAIRYISYSIHVLNYLPKLTDVFCWWNHYTHITPIQPDGSEGIILHLKNNKLILFFLLSNSHLQIIKYKLTLQL